MDTEELRKLVLGKRIAIKLAPKGQAGWYLGTVCTVVDSAIHPFPGDAPRQCAQNDAARAKCNVLIKYEEYDEEENDPEFQHSYLSKSNMTSDGNASIYCWGLIETVGLSNVANADVIRNPLRPAPGKRATFKRRKPKHGPTSGNKVPRR